MTTQSPTADTLAACALARGELPPDPAVGGVFVQAAWRIMDAAQKNGSEGYRRRLPAGKTQWRWVSTEPLPEEQHLVNGDWSAAVYGAVVTGDLIATFERTISRSETAGRAMLTGVALVAVGRGQLLRECGIRTCRYGQLCISLPDGTELAVPPADW